MLNSIGLQNPGVEAVIQEELPKLAKCFRKPVIANVSGFSAEEYAEVCRLLDAQNQVGWLEVNISCPNVHGGGMSFGTGPETAAEITRAVKAVTTKPVIMKLSLIKERFSPMKSSVSFTVVALLCTTSGI